MIKPLPGYVLLEPIEDDEKTAGGLYKPDSSKDKPCKGKVVGMNFPPLGNDTENYGIQETIWTDLLVQIKMNGIVVYKKWTNQEVEYEGKTYLLVNFNELLAIIE